MFVVSMLVAVGAGGAHAGAIGPADTVVLVSVDGMRWDYAEKAKAPGFARLRAEGASCRSLVPPFPTSTFPAHASLATGVYPDRHGIVGNEFVDRRRGPYHREDDASWLLAEPIWVTAERQGVPTAVYHWVFSYTAWHGVAPTLSVPFSRGTKDEEKIDRIIEWLTRRDEKRPRLILSYLHGPDSAGHADGPESPAVMERVMQTDRLLVRLLRTLEAVPKSALVVVSDHGMAEVSRVIRTRELLGKGAARGARPVSSGPVCNIYCPDVPSCDAAEVAFRRVRGLTLFRMDALPEELRYRQPARVGNLVAIAPAGAYFTDADEEARPARGMHGYLPDRQEMQGIFYAWGAGVRRGARRESLRAVDVTSLICRLLGIDCPEGIDGRAPADLLVESGARPRPGGTPTPSRHAVPARPGRAKESPSNPRTPAIPPEGPGEPGSAKP